MPPKLKTQPRRQPQRGAARTNAEVPNVPMAKETLPSNDETDVEIPKASEQLPPPEPITLSEPNVVLDPVPTPISTADQPSRRPVQRLASLHPRNPPAPGLDTPSASGNRPSGLKFQPRSFIRRSKEEREAQEHAEAERRKARFAADGLLSHSVGGRGGMSSRGGGRGSFGGSMNRWQNDRYSGGQASGHLGGSTLSETTKKKKNPGLTSFLGPDFPATARSGSVREKTELAVKPEKDRDGDVIMGAATNKRRPKVKEEDQGPAYISSEDDKDPAEGPRVNIEHINLVSDDEDDCEEDNPEESTQSKGKQLERGPKISSSALKPIRIDRHEHVERAVGVSSEAGSLTMADMRRKTKERALADGDLLVSDGEPEFVRTSKTKGKKGRDVEFVRKERRWQGVYPDEEDDKQGTVKVKEEPQDEDDYMIINRHDAVNPVVDNAMKATPPPALPKVPRKVEPSSTRANAKRRRMIASRTLKPVLQTDEDRQEWTRYQEDLNFLGDELGALNTGPAALDEDGNAKPDIATSEVTKDQKDGLVYLFQLPPVIPNLITQTEKKEKASKEAKKSPEPQPKTQPSKTSGFPGNATQSNLKIKAEPDPQSTDKKPPSGPATFQTEQQGPKTYLGHIGTLTVHETGRVMATWGGASMEVGRGGEGGLLMEVMMVGDQKGVEAGEDEGRGVGKKGWAVGQLGGGFVLTPDWMRMFAG